MAPPLLRYPSQNPTFMLLQKTLHMNTSLEDCQESISSIQSYRRQFFVVTKATVTSSKTVDFSFRGPFGFKARTVLLAVDSDSPSQFAFESVGGNIELMGLIDFTEIRSNCTEVTLALHYDIKNKLFAWLDRHLHFVDAVVDAESAQYPVEHFHGLATPYRERAPIMPIFETAAA